MELFWFTFGVVWFVLGVFLGRFVFAMVGALIAVWAFFAGIFALLGA